MKRRLATARQRLLQQQLSIKKEKEKLVSQKKKKLLAEILREKQEEATKMINRNWKRYKARKEEYERAVQAELDKKAQEEKEVRNCDVKMICLVYFNCFRC